MTLGLLRTKYSSATPGKEHTGQVPFCDVTLQLRRHSRVSSPVVFTLRMKNPLYDATQLVKYPHCHVRLRAKYPL